MNYKDITGSLSKPSKMPGHAYGLPAKECKTGSKLAKVEGSTCSSCYALKGCYVFEVVQAAQYKRLKSIKHPRWVEAMASQINAKRNKFFRWHDSGDVQDVEHLSKIFAVCRMTPDTSHWMPTREAWVKKYLYPTRSNPLIRFSATMVDQDAPASWPNTSTVVTKSAAATCPAPKQLDKDGKPHCKDCRACWDKSVKNVAYAAH